MNKSVWGSHYSQALQCQRTSATISKSPPPTVPAAEVLRPISVQVKRRIEDVVWRKLIHSTLHR
ncbi:hypothetical protein J6590_074971, partial [Homalodisca vitripennis]